MELDGKTGVEISDELGLADDERQRLQNEIKFEKRSLKNIVRKTVMSADYDELINIELNRLTFSPIVERLSYRYENTGGIENDLLYKKVQMYMEGQTDYDLREFQSMLNRGLSYTRIAKSSTQKISRSTINKLVRRGYLVLKDKPNRKGESRGMNKEIHKLIFNADSKKHYVKVLNRSNSLVTEIDDGKLSNLDDFDRICNSFLELNAVARLLFIGINNESEK